MRARIALPLAAVFALGILTIDAGRAVAAVKPPKFHHLARGTGPALTDGRRFIVVPTADSIVVYDARTDRRRAESAPREQSGPSAGHLACRPQDLGGGTLLWSCGQVEDLATGTRHDAPAIYGDGIAVHVGRHWMERMVSSRYSYSGHEGPPFPVFIDWRTGQVRFSAFMNHYGDHHVEALDWPTLMRPLCRPLQRPSYGTDDGYGRQTFAYAEVTYEPPFGLTRSSRDEPMLGRCGRSPFIRIARCSDDRVQCLYAQLGGGVVTWSDAIGVYAYRAASRRRLAWNLLAASGLRDPGTILPVGHAGRDVVVSVPRGNHPYYPSYYPQSGPWDIRVARLPRPG